MVSKNNKYQKELLNSRQLPHFGLRKLGIGVTSVLLGTTFYFGGNAATVHADVTPATVGNTGATQTVDANSAENSQAVALKTSTTAGTSMTNTVSSQSASTAASVSAAANQSSVNNASTAAPVSSAISQSQVSAGKANVIAAYTLNTNNLQTSANAASASAATSASSAYTTMTLPQSASATSANNNVAQQAAVNLAASPASSASSAAQNGTYWAESVQSINLIRNSKAITNTINLDVKNTPTLFGLEGQFSVNSDYLKKGNIIDIGELNYSNSSNGKYSNLKMYATPQSNILTYQGQNVGYLDIGNENNHQLLQLHVTNDVKAIGTAQLSFKTGSSDNAIGINLYGTDAHIYKPVPYSETISFNNKNDQPIQTYKFNFTFTPSAILGDGKGQVNPISRWLGGDSMNKDIGYLHDNVANWVVPSVQVLDDLQNSQGQKGNVNTAPYKAYYRISVGSKSNPNSKKDVDDETYGINNKSLSATVYPMLYSLNSDGKLVAYEVDGPQSQLKTKDFSSQVPNSTMSDTQFLNWLNSLDFEGLAYARQSDGTYLAVLNMPNDVIKLTAAAKTNLYNSPDVVFANDEAKARQYVDSYYGGVLKDLPISFSMYIGASYNKSGNGQVNPDEDVTLSALDQNGKEILSPISVSPQVQEATVKDQSGLNIQYINVDTGLEMGNEQAVKTIYADPSTKQTVTLPSFDHYHLVTKVNQSGNVITLGNGRTITLGANDVVAQVNSDSKTISVTYPSTQSTIGNVYVFYQGDPETAKVEILDADTKDAKGPNGYKLLETKNANAGNYGSALTFPSGQDPETIVRYYVYTANYKYDPNTDLNKSASAYQFNKHYTYNLGDNNNGANTYYIYLTHQTTPLNRTITRTINYVYTDGTKAANSVIQKINFTGAHDAVTNSDTWTGNKDNTFAAVKSPTITDYTPSQATVGAEANVNYESPNEVYTVVYVKKPATPAEQKAQVVYLDQDSNNAQIAASPVLTGPTGSLISYHTTAEIKILENQGYELVSDGFPDGDAAFDNVDDSKENNGQGQIFKVILKHGTTTVTPQNPGTPGQPINPNDPQGPKYPAGTDAKDLTKTNTQTIHYTGAGSLTPKDSVTTVQFDHHLVIDKVTGKVVNDDGWTPAQQAHQYITTPAVSGYVPDQYYAGGATVTPGDTDKTYTVTYHQAPAASVKDQTAVVRYLDQDEGNAMIAESPELTGKPNTKINYSTASELKTLTGEGYVMVNNGYDYEGQNQYFDSNDDSEQVFIVTLKHGQSPVNPTHPNKNVDPSQYEKDVTFTVHYVGAGDQTPKDSVQTAKWTRTLTYDNVTKQLIHGQYDTDWTPNKTSYDSVATPIVNGYTPDQSYVPSKPVAMTNETTTVTYAKSGTTQPSGSSQPSGTTQPSGASQPSGQTSNQSQPSNQTQPSGQTSQSSQSSNNSQPTQASQGSNGNNNNQPTQPSQGSNGSQPTTPGQVTNPGQNSGTSQPSGNTQPSQGQNSNQTQPTTPGQVTTPGQNSNGNQSQPSGNSQPSGQQPTTPGQNSGTNQPSGNTQPSQGQNSNQTQPTTPGQVTSPSQNSGTSQPSGNVQPTVPGQVTTPGQVTNPGQSSNQLTTPGQSSNGSQSSQGSNGNSQGQPTTPGQSSTPSQNTNGQNGNNNGNQPTNPNPGQNGNQPSNQNPTPDNETAIIKYVDPDTGETVTTDTVTGRGGQPINYDPTKTITDLENKGYEIVKNNIPSNAAFDHDPSTNQTYTITVKHGTATVGPNDQHQAGTPINPNDPNGAKWPSSDEYTKTYTYTIHYVDQNGNKLAPDKVQTSTWTRTLQVDKVTGQILNPDAAWTPDIKKYADVANPVINGYYTAAKTLTGPTAQQSNLETSVTYSKLGKVIPVDENGNPLPNASQTYQNDSTDPTKAAANQSVPTVSGYTPAESAITPANPGGDTTVVYHKGNNSGNGNANNGQGTNGTSGQNNSGTNSGSNQGTAGASTTQPANSGSVSANGSTGAAGTPATGNGTNTGHTSFVVPAAPSKAEPSFDTTGLGGSVETPIQNQPLSFTENGSQNGTTTTTTSTKLPQTGNSEDGEAAMAGLVGLAMTSGLLGLALNKKQRA